MAGYVLAPCLTGGLFPRVHARKNTRWTEVETGSCYKNIGQKQMKTLPSCPLNQRMCPVHWSVWLSEAGPGGHWGGSARTRTGQLLVVRHRERGTQFWMCLCPRVWDLGARHRACHPRLRGCRRGPPRDTATHIDVDAATLCGTQQLRIGPQPVRGKQQNVASQQVLGQASQLS